MDAHFAEERVFIPACQDMAVTVPQKEAMARARTFIWQPYMLVSAGRRLTAYRPIRSLPR